MKRTQGLVTRTPLARRTPLQQVGRRAIRQGRKPRPRDTGPDRNTRLLVMERDDWRCVRCGAVIFDGTEYSLQHRLARGLGGTSNPAINSPANLVVLCGSAVTRCHNDVTNGDIIEAQDLGYVIPLNRGLNPARVPVLSYDRGLIFLDDEGGWAPATLGGAA